MPEIASLGTAMQLSEQGPPPRAVLLGVSPDLVRSPTGYEFTKGQGFAGIDQLAAAGAHAYIATGGCPERRGSAEATDLLTDIENMGRSSQRRMPPARRQARGGPRFAVCDATGFPLACEDAGCSENGKRMSLRLGLGIAGLVAYEHSAYPASLPNTRQLR